MCCCSPTYLGGVPRSNTWAPCCLDLAPMLLAPPPRVCRWESVCAMGVGTSLGWWLVGTFTQTHPCTLLPPPVCPPPTSLGLPTPSPPPPPLTPSSSQRARSPRSPRWRRVTQAEAAAQSRALAAHSTSPPPTAPGASAYYDDQDMGSGGEGDGGTTDGGGASGVDSGREGGPSRTRGRPGHAATSGQAAGTKRAGAWLRPHHMGMMDGYDGWVPV
jgi:hypothetical protein